MATVPRTPPDHPVQAGRTDLAEARSGDITLASATAPTSVSATSRSGDIDVAVPPGTGYRVAVDSRSGQSRVLVPPDPTATAMVSAVSDHGDVTVRTG